MENYPLMIQPTCIIRDNRLKFEPIALWGGADN